MKLIIEELSYHCIIHASDLLLYMCNTHFNIVTLYTKCWESVPKTLTTVNGVTNAWVILAGLLTAIARIMKTFNYCQAWVNNLQNELLQGCVLYRKWSVLSLGRHCIPGHPSRGLEHDKYQKWNRFIYPTNQKFRQTEAGRPIKFTDHIISSAISKKQKTLIGNLCVVGLISNLSMSGDHSRLV